MSPQHHPGDDLLIDYAAGYQEEPVALVVATHLALCPRCQRDVARLEALGGALLESEEVEALNPQSLKAVLDRLDEPAPEAAARSAPRPDRVDALVPRPLRDYLGKSVDQLDWTTFRGLQKIEILSDFPDFRTRLMRIRSGTAMPVHTHEGCELTLVLAGGFTDESGHFLRGDLAEADGSVVHQPIADPGGDCICLAVTDAPLRLTGPLGRLLNPFLRI